MAKKSRSMQARTILAALAMADLKVSDVARMAKKTDPYIWQIIDGDRTGYKVRPIIAKACKKTVLELWPDTPPEHRRAA